MDTLLELDKIFTIFLNSYHNSILDHIMFFISGKKEWIPLYAVMLYYIFKEHNWKKGILIVICIAILITLCDRIASGFFKPFFERLRPSRNLELSEIIQIVNGYRGGKFGFLSSHSANAFGLAMFISYVFNKKWVTISLLAWATIVAYSRVYLGVHYLGDVLCGAVLGLLISFLVNKLYLYMNKRLKY